MITATITIMVVLGFLLLIVKGLGNITDVDEDEMTKTFKK